VAKLSKLVAVKCLWALQRQTEADCQGAEECKRKHPLKLVQSNIGLLRVFEPVEIGIGNNWMKENDCFTNELEVLNQSPFVWPLVDSKNRNIIGAGATN
jgi:hypothetical protein